MTSNCQWLSLATVTSGFQVKTDLPCLADLGDGIPIPSRVSDRVEIGWNPTLSNSGGHQEEMEKNHENSCSWEGLAVSWKCAQFLGQWSCNSWSVCFCRRVVCVCVRTSPDDRKPLTIMIEQPHSKPTNIASNYWGLLTSSEYQFPTSKSAWLRINNYSYTLHYLTLITLHHSMVSTTLLPHDIQPVQPRSQEFS